MDQLVVLGSVVHVSADEQTVLRMVVAGYFPCDSATGTIYDYSAVLYPWGMQMNPALQMFNRTQIVSVEHEGYMDEDGRNVTAGIPRAIEEYRQRVERRLREEDGAGEEGTGEEKTGKDGPGRTAELMEFG